VGVPVFRVSYSLDSSSISQDIHVESANAADVYQHMQRRFPIAYEKMIITAVVEYRQSDEPKGA
jgi:hypothetical protein